MESVLEGPRLAGANGSEGLDFSLGPRQTAAVEVLTEDQLNGVFHDRWTARTVRVAAMMAAAPHGESLAINLAVGHI